MSKVKRIKSEEKKAKKKPIGPSPKLAVPPETDEEAKLRAYFRRIFGENESQYEDRVQFVGKWVLFGLLILCELLIVLQHMEKLILKEIVMFF